MTRLHPIGDPVDLRWAWRGLVFLSVSGCIYSPLKLRVEPQSADAASETVGNGEGPEADGRVGDHDPDACSALVGYLDLGFRGGGAVVYDYFDDDLPVPHSQDDRASGVAIDSLRRIVVSGSGSYNFRVNCDQEDMATLSLRLLPNGEFDTTYQWGVTSTPGTTVDSDSIFSHGEGVLVDTEGRIVIVGYREWAGTDDPALYRYLPSNGQLDTTFGVAGVANVPSPGEVQGWAVAQDPTDGNYLVAGSLGSLNIKIAKLSSLTGSLVGDFGSDGVLTYDVAGPETPNALLVDGSGWIYVGGSFDGSRGTRDLRVLRFLNDGTLDSSFSTAGTFSYDSGGNDEARGMAFDRQGALIVVGSTELNNLDLLVLRLDPATGALDAGFATDGVFTYDSRIGSANDVGRAVAVAPGGEIYVTGESEAADATRAMAVWALHSNGTPDTHFGGHGVSTVPGVFLTAGAAGGAEDRGLGLAIDGCDSVVVVGESASASGYFDIAIWRIR